jgi:hypothetical protein
MTRIRSAEVGVLTMLRNADERLPSITVGRPRSNRDERVHDADSSALSRCGDSVPLRNRSVCAHEFNCVIAGCAPCARSAFNSGGEPRNSIERNDVRRGSRGTSDTAIPGALTVDRHQAGRDLDAIPLLDAGDEQRHAGAGRARDVGVADAEDRLRPGAAVRADTGRGAGAQPAGVDAVGDDVRNHRVEQREEVGARRQLAERADGDRGAERWPFLGHGRWRRRVLRAGGDRVAEERDDEGRAIESGYAGSHFQ